MKRFNVQAVICGVMAAVAIAAAPLSAKADSIGVNFYRTDVVSEPTGAVSQSNWNNVSTEFFDYSQSDLKDSGGNTSTADLAATSNCGWSINGSQTADQNDLLNSYLNSNTTTVVTISQIPYTKYDAYVYVSSDGQGRTGSVTNGVTTYYLSLAGVSNQAFTRTTSTTTDSYPTANYAKFEGLTANSATFTCSVPSWGGIAAIQIVSVPEPSTVALLASALIGLLAYAWRKRN